MDSQRGERFAQMNKCKNKEKREMRNLFKDKNVQILTDIEITMSILSTFL